ncbi:glycoside hydrolase family 57 protein [Desulfotruncus alcoholivorax]|uniref:glycoside hydrolase family 57 protein n=1 Tax=Desulfotruncus alcoholivorax TaxID=265477 RepID=UPI000487D155|nr:1,4-alpha-glucan branching protein domain-containing protein [Desulfotruncus alcoholivorax]
MANGFLCFVLHAHLPFVRHPEYEYFLEERWLFEAITETYVPLIEKFDELVDEGIPFRLTFSVSPTLVSMLTDGLLQQRYLKYIDNLIELAHKETTRTSGTEFHPIALMYRDRLLKIKHIYTDKYQFNLINALAKLKHLNRLEVITCAATHGFLPLMIHPEAIRAQIGVAVDIYNKHFGETPVGFWLPECAYSEGVDSILKEFGIKYFLTDTHGVLFASHRPKFGIYAPIYCPTGVAVFGRDMESSKQVWSSNEGYPGDFDYREYYRDIGHDLEYGYIQPHIHPDGIRVNTGLKYFRITGKDNHKEPYNRENALRKADIHAGNFLFNREHQIKHLCSLMDREPIIVAPYDAELFGHWWFEGPEWLKSVLRKAYYDFDLIETITPGDYLKKYPCNQVARPCPSTWGNKGYNEVWLCRENDWIYRHLHIAAGRMIELASNHHHSGGLTERALKQAARELLLAQSSDWAFIMNTGTMVEYAILRTKQHIHNFLALYDQIKSNYIDAGMLAELENKNNIFPDIDINYYNKAV